MLDPACELRTFADALYVGRACDEAGYFWFEDPYRDSGVSAFGHRKLREMLKTPILQTEHIRGVEPKADYCWRHRFSSIGPRIRFRNNWMYENTSFC